ncbi:RNA polymerase sigma factor [Flindersiella endophytica]
MSGDADEVARCRAGDLDAYSALVARYTVLAHRTAVLFGAGDDAEDVVQEAFVKAYRNLHRFRLDGEFRPWLLRIVVNETKNLHRSRRRRDGMVLRLGAVTVRDLDLSGPEPEPHAVSRERDAELLAAVRKLPEKDQRVLACRYFLDLGEAETAQLLGWPRGSVKSRTARALARLRLALTGARDSSREEVAGG